MQRRVNALEGLNPEDQLAWLLLRVVAELSPCTERSLLDRILGSALLSRQASNSHTRELVCSALIKLNELTFIRFTNARIAITDQGRQFLDELPAGGLGGQSAETSESWGYTSGTINRALRAPPWTLYIAPLREFVATLLARCIPVLNRLCQNRLGGTGGNMPQSLLISGVRARDVAFEAWKRKVAAIWVQSSVAQNGPPYKRASSSQYSRELVAPERGRALEERESPLPIPPQPARWCKPLCHFCRRCHADRPVHSWVSCSPFRQTYRERRRGCDSEFTRISLSLVL